MKNISEVASLLHSDINYDIIISKLLDSVFFSCDGSKNDHTGDFAEHAGLLSCKVDIWMYNIPSEMF
jgi:hypothetical protein